MLTLVIFLRALVSAPLLLILPGYVTRLAWFPLTSSDEPQEALSFWGEVLLYSLIWTGTCGVLLAHLGWFSLTRLCLLSLIYIVLAALWMRRKTRPFRVRLCFDRREGAALLLLVALALALFFHPHEFIFGGADAGVYVNLGANIARTGAWIVHDPVIADLPSELYAGVFREHPDWMIPQYVPLPGTYLTRGAIGEITPQFYPLHPVWIAVFYAVGGVRLGLFATPLWGVLGCVMVYLAAREIFGRRVGWLSAAFLAFTATQIWFSRYPTAEVLTQLLLFGGIYAFSRHLKLGSRTAWWGVLSGLALGHAMLVRLDLYFLLAIPVGYGLYLRFQQQLDRRFWVFTLPFVLQALYSLLFGFTQTWPYFYNVYSLALRALPTLWPYLAGVCVLAVLGLVVLDRHLFHSAAGRRWVQRAWFWGSRILAVVVLLLAFYAYFVRPRLTASVSGYYYWYGDHQIPNVEAFNFVRLGWYLSPLGLALGVLGAWLVLWRGLNTRNTLLMGMGLLFSILFIQSSRNNPHHIYVMRRYVPVVIPFFMMMAACAIDALAVRHSMFWRGAAVAIAVLLGGWLLLNARVVIQHVEFGGLTPQFERLAEALGPRPAVLLFNDTRSLGPAASVGTPLRYLEGFTVFDLQEEHLDVAVLAAEVARWQANGLRVLIVEGEDPDAVMFAAWPCTSLGSFELRYPVLEASYTHVPRAIWEATSVLKVCELADLP